jgi:cysteine synthase A
MEKVEKNSYMYKVYMHNKYGRWKKMRNKIYDNIGELIGNTPIVQLNLTGPEDATLWGKLEYMNPGGSVKDRIGLAMINAAEKDGLKKGDTIIEATSGNTGIALAMITANRGYRLVLTMPAGVSEERKQLLKAYGAELLLVKPEDGPGMTGAIKLAEFNAGHYDDYYTRQFDNPANPEIHEKTTGPEIVDVFENSGKTLDYFVAGVGTGGTITGAGKILRQNYPDIKIYAVEPSTSRVLAGEKPGPNKITGIGAGFIPKNLDTKIYDGIIPVSFEDAKETANKLASIGILGGISSGAATYAALETAKGKGRDKNVLVIIPSNGERYLSTGLYAP